MVSYGVVSLESRVRFLLVSLGDIRLTLFINDVNPYSIAVKYNRFSICGGGSDSL